VRYVPDRTSEDEWRNSKDTWQMRRGDCEDMATCVRDLCTEKGLTADVYVFSSKAPGGSHAVAIGASDGKMWMSSNGGFTHVRSLAHAKRKAAQYCGWRTERIAHFKVLTPE